MSPALIATVVLVLLFVGLLWAMRSGWLRRGSRTSVAVPALPLVPDAALLGPARCEPVEATYVSTTLAGDWLERVVAHGLGVRSAAVVHVHEAGVLIARSGAPDVFVPAGDLRGVGRAPGIAGKYVGGQGLVVLTWRIGCDDSRDTRQTLDTGLRTRRAADRDLLTDAVADLLPATARPSTAQPSTAQPSTTQETP